MIPGSSPGEVRPGKEGGGASEASPDASPPNAPNNITNSIMHDNTMFIIIIIIMT